MTPTSPAPLPFARLPWTSRFTDRLPADPETAAGSRQVRHAAYSRVDPTPVRAPRLLGWSGPLAAELGIARPGPGDEASLELLAGNRVLPGMRPYAARYGGHQFGHWAGQLGDGRAITLGEASLPGVGALEFQLKGSGPTPYSRRADGRAVLRSSLREFLCSEAMHSLGVPTTRALALIGTGDEVVRDMFYDGRPEAEPGAIVCRVAPSFLRFGNFEILAAQGEPELLRRLVDLLIEDHYPELGDPRAPDAPARLLEEIARRTARTIAHWMRVGFVHGVMNTDNLSALGLTIDYGPYGWLEPFDPGWTPNVTDAQGRRYRFGAQPAIALWNLAQLGQALLPLLGGEHGGEDRLEGALAVYRDVFEETYGGMLARKLGLDVPTLSTPEDARLVEDLFALMQATETDFTVFFRALARWNPDAAGLSTGVASAFYAGPPAPDLGASWDAWGREYAACLRRDGRPDADRARAMNAVNPKYVPRNYLAQTAIRAAESGDLSVLQRLQRVLERPYDEHPGDEDLAARRPEWARSAPGCSALSCSS